MTKMAAVPQPIAKPFDTSTPSADTKALAKYDAHLVGIVKVKHLTKKR